MARYRDFDAAWAEAHAEPLKAKVKGKLYTFPGRVPAKLVLSLAKTQKESDPNDPASLEMLLEVMEPLVGKEAVREWLDAGIDIRELGDVVGWAMEQYGQSADAPTPEEQAAANGNPTTPTPASAFPD